MSFRNLRDAKIPNPGPLLNIAKVAALGAFGLYAAANSLYNVEGGHRAIVFNRIEGIRDKVRGRHFPSSWIASLFFCHVSFPLALLRLFWGLLILSAWSVQGCQVDNFFKMFIVSFMDYGSMNSG
jgi:hypothetical protein